MEIKDNIGVAIYTKVNALAERHGLKPYDFVAVVESGPGDEIRLDFEWPAEGSVLKAERYEAMLKNIGILEGRILQGTDQRIIDALDNALQLAPKQPIRR